MHARLLKPCDYRAMPWKNGLGTTTELAIEPAGATLESGFQWRLSMADIREDGPFSPFPGCTRTLLLIEGKGIELDFHGNGHRRLDRTFEAVSFQGDWSVSSRLLDGPCRDFNVITRRGLRQEVRVLRPDPRVLLPAAPTLLVFCARGQARVNDSLLGPQELLRLEGAGAAEVSSEAPETLLVAIAIAPETEE